MSKFSKPLVMLLAAVVLLAGCTKKSSEKQILTFSFFDPEVEATVMESAKTVVAKMPAGTDVTALVPIITVSDKATVNPASGLRQDFTNSVIYTVTAEDGSQASYAVAVTVEGNGGGGNGGGGNGGGSSSGLFSVSETKKVHFASGNLQATTTNLGSTWTWTFAQNQWDYVGDAAANNAINGNGTVSTNGTVDLFGWSTASTYFGIHNDTFDAYSGDFVDWGTNTITNSGGYTWFTLSHAEWEYLYNNHTHGWTTVNGVKGEMVRPDGVTTAIASSYTAEAWAAEEAAGALFLPAAGYRWKTDVTYIGDGGWYWSSTPNDTEFAYYDGSYWVRYHGCSVRLARLAE